MTLGLDRVRDLLSLLGEPHRRLRVVQVVGTNGKGTTAIALAAALQATGLEGAGCYLSPHVLSYTERLWLREEPASEGLFAAAMGEAIQASDAGGVPASQFELLTAGALKLFADEGLGWAVLEAGLGARHDATSAAAPEAVVLTNVALDHTEHLGATVEEIAAEKLASVASGATLVLGTGDPRVVALARERCEAVGARLVEAAPSLDGIREWRGASPPDLTASSLLAPYARRSARLGVVAAEVLVGRSLRPAERDRALRAPGGGTLPARFEVHQVGGVPVIVDGAHNPAALEAVLGGVRALWGQRPLAVVFGALRDKNVGSMLCALENEAHFLVLTRPEEPRSADPAGIEREYGPRDREGRRALVAEQPQRALDLAVEGARGSGGVVLVVGSLYTAASVLGWLRER